MMHLAFWHHAVSSSTSSGVHTPFRWSLSFTSSIHSCTTASMFSYIIAVKFHPSTDSWSAFSFLSTFTFHSKTSWPDPMTWSPTIMDHVVVSWFASAMSMTNSPSWPSLVEWWVAPPQFLISSRFSSITSSQNAAFCCTWHLGFHCVRWALNSPVWTVPPSRLRFCQFNICAGLSPDRIILWSLMLIILNIFCHPLMTSVAMTSSLAPLLESVCSSTTRPLPLRIACQGLFLFLISYS